MNRLQRIFWTALSVAVVGLLIAVAFRVTQPADSNGQAGILFNGMVDESRNFSLEDIKSMPSVTITSELICVSGDSLGVHDWTGVRLSYILNITGIQEGAVKVAFSATDGYKTDLNISTAMRSDVIIAYLKDGSPMSDKTKLVVPGMWGYKWISDIERIWLVDYNYMGNWEGRGYPDDATI